jgi:hypothetical protein
MPIDSVFVTNNQSISYLFSISIGIIIGTFLTNKNIRSDFITAYTDYLEPNKHDKILTDERSDYWTDGNPDKEIEFRKIVYDKLQNLLEFAEFK